MRNTLGDILWSTKKSLGAIDPADAAYRSYYRHEIERTWKSLLIAGVVRNSLGRSRFGLRARTRTSYSNKYLAQIQRSGTVRKFGRWTDEMTFCIGVRVNEGIVALADTRIVKGGERLSKAKLALHLAPGGSYFTMTSGLRSVRDKMLIYGEESIMRSAEPLTRLYQVVNLLGEELRRVKREDGPSLQASHLDFNLHAIVGGRLSEDPRPTMFLIYPEGNWIEVNDDSPYFMIGRTPFGRPILDRHLHSQRPLKMATALALMAFDMTASSVTDVDYPIDVAMMRRDQFEFAQHRYEHADLQAATSHWYNAVAQSLLTMPTHWLTPFDPQL